MTANMACEFAKDGIRVNTISPWYTSTPLAEQVLKDETFRNCVQDATPMRRIGTVEEVANVCAFLCMEKASYITGQNIIIDGGFSKCGFFPNSLNK